MLLCLLHVNTWRKGHEQRLKDIGATLRFMINQTTNEKWKEIYNGISQCNDRRE